MQDEPMAAASPNTSSEQLEWAHRRSRLGLKLGPATLLVYLGVSFVAGEETGSPHSGLGLVLGLVFVVAALAHVASFIECVATIPAWGYRPIPRPVVLLSIYWIGVLAWLAVGFVQGAT